MKNLFKALAEFQQKCPTILKDTKGFGYNYADLPAILQVINPLLKEVGMGFTQCINGGELVTTIFHVESGETLESKTTIPLVVLKGMNEYQSFGSGITYYRRYCLSSMLGIVTDKDTDASGEQVTKKLPTLDAVRWAKALESVVKGEYDKSRLPKEYDLTPSQLKDLEKC